MEYTKKIESGEREESEGHAIGIVRCIQMWEVGLETSQPVLDMPFSRESGGLRYSTQRHFKNTLREREA